ncbi:MAG: NADH-ubiquinone oxidoreductase subunit E family protein [Wolinella sp.]
MKRFDLRHLGDSFETRMGEILDSDLRDGEVAIFIFEIGDFTPIERSALLIDSRGDELLNSIRFNEVDWTIVVRRAVR